MSIPHPSSPFRPPDWRARRSSYLIEQRKRPSCRDDGATREVWRFFRALTRSGDERQRVRRRWPHLAAAVALSQDAPQFRRWELEARLLAREPVEVVAGRFGLTSEAVGAYVSLYFDVLHVLDATDYMVLQVIGLSPLRTFTEMDVGVWLKFYAYMGGPHVLESLLDYYANPEAVPADLTRLEPARRARVMRHLTIRAAILAECVPDGDARLLALRSLAERREAEQRGEALAGAILPPVRLGKSTLEDLYQEAWAPKVAEDRVAG